MFPIAPHFVAYALPNIVLLEPIKLGECREFHDFMFEWILKYQVVYKISELLW
jgi:hypothetical protein